MYTFFKIMYLKICLEKYIQIYIQCAFFITSRRLEAAGGRAEVLLGEYDFLLQG